MMHPHRTRRRELGDPVSSEPSSDPEPYSVLFARVVEGDEGAFGELFLALCDKLCVFAEMYVGSRHVAEEIVDDVFLKLWSERARLRVHGSVRNYLYVAVRNSAMNYLSHRKVERRYTESLGRDDGWLSRHDVNDGEDRVRSEELSLRVRRAIDALPERARQTYLLYYQHHLSYAEVAAIMGVTAKTVENQLSRSLKALWLHLKDVFE